MKNAFYLAGALLFVVAGQPALAYTETAPGPVKVSEQVHKGQGTVNRVDKNAGKINLSHDAIASLNWPAMTMDFQVRDKALLEGVKPGARVDFEVAQTPRGPVIIRLKPAK
jgi:Cu(I)/Ag(I) efflux system membrane fusion protein